MGGCSSKDGDKLRDLVRGPASNVLPQAKHLVGMTTVGNSGTGRETGQENVVILDGQTSFNACRELHEVRGMVSRLRGEIDVGLTRLDMLIQKLESNGPGQDTGLQKGGGSKGKEKRGVESLSPKLTRHFKPKAAGWGTEAKGAKLSVWKPLENALGPSRRASTPSRGCRP